ncbi:MAG: hypothetical protein DRP00_00890 [Candidatus Aenigmatarchaeota archaeon]|nr:MAG: hypothetical protein DRP00_00890 [Candidatus Aenigmarchaeota archaeon]
MIFHFFADYIKFFSFFNCFKQLLKLMFKFLFVQYFLGDLKSGKKSGKCRCAIGETFWLGCCYDSMVEESETTHNVYLCWLLEVFLEVHG